MPCFQDLYVSTDSSLVMEIQELSSSQFLCCFMWGVGAHVALISANGGRACKSLPLLLKDWLRVQILTFLYVPVVFASIC